MCAWAAAPPRCRAGLACVTSTISIRARRRRSKVPVTSKQVPGMLVCVPSRGRPDQLARLVEACQSTCRGLTDIAVGVDVDDPMVSAYMGMKAQMAGMTLRGTAFHCATRKPLSDWTNDLVRLHPGYTYYASLGDDHVPRTEGWDVKLMKAIENIGGMGFAYGDDLNMGVRLPTAWVASAKIVNVLGWLIYPGVRHYCGDNVTADLGAALGCLAYEPDVIIEHLHPSTGKAALDDTYMDAGGFSTDHQDYAAYLWWREHAMMADVKRIEAARGR